MVKDYVYNPHNVAEDSLPSLYGVVTTSTPSNFSVVVITKDGKCIYQHVSPNEYWAKIDIGFTGEGRGNLTSIYGAIYPEGYKTEFVPFGEMYNHSVVGKLFTTKPKSESPDEDNLVKLIELLDKNHQFHSTSGITRFMLRGLGSVDSNDLRAIADEVDLRNGVVKQT